MNRSLRQIRISSLRIVKIRKYSEDFSINLKKFDTQKIRNFSIIAHIDHGKSTLADRLLELAGNIDPSSSNKQVLDRLQVERERGITVKAQTASLIHNKDGQNYLLNLIDTPGHIDFTYEVSRSLNACQGCLLIVDAAQGIQAQTISNFYLAFEAGLYIIPVINKIDLKNAKVDTVVQQLKTTLDFEEDEILKISAKTGLNCSQVLNAIVDRIPKPIGNINKPFKALIFDSQYENYRGAVIMIACVDGKIQKGDLVSSCYSGKSYEVQEIGLLRPNQLKTNELYAGQVGYMICNIRSLKEALVGDTIYQSGHQVEALPGFKAPKPMVYSGFFPTSSSEYNALRSAIDKLCLNDSSVTVANDSSPALGSGFRLGFLGLLHMEVFSERLEKEFEIDVVVTAPNLPYRVKILGQKNIKVNKSDDIYVLNPCLWPEEDIIEKAYEPMVLGNVIAPPEYKKLITDLCQKRRGVFKEEEDLSRNRIMLKYVLPMNEIIVDFFDKLKSITSGYASFDYELLDYEESNLAKMTILLNDEEIEELTQIVHIDRAVSIAKHLVTKLHEEVPRELYKIAIQAKVRGRIVARETIPAYRKDVTAKCYGGDKTRQRKLLEQQREGKKKLRSQANIKLSKTVLINVLKKE